MPRRAPPAPRIIKFCIANRAHDVIYSIIVTVCLIIVRITKNTGPKSRPRGTPVKHMNKIRILRRRRAPREERETASRRDNKHCAVVYVKSY